MRRWSLVVLMSALSWLLPAQRGSLAAWATTSHGEPDKPIIDVDLSELEPGTTLPRSLPRGDVTLELWIKGDYTAEQSTPLLESLADSAGDDILGWQMTADVSGAWRFIMKRGEQELDYLPTAARQGVFDDNWHQLAFAYIAQRRELRLFFDGINVAIYAINGYERCFGGSIHRLAQGLHGALGPLRVWDSALADSDIATAYHTQMRRFEPSHQPAPAADHAPVRELSVMSWNIWHGGRENGADLGPQQVIDVIRAADPDVICMQETYGSGPRIADALGYYFYLRSSNLSIMSRYPIHETHDLYQPFRLGGARIRLDQYRSVNVFSLWIHYLPDHWVDPIASTTTAQDLIDAEGQTRVNEIGDIIAAVGDLIEQTDTTPLIIAGDYNSSSHLDWTQRTKRSHMGYVVNWPVSNMMHDAGFIDGYRTVHRDELTHPGRTWTPRFPEQLQDRIDYVYTQGLALSPVQARMIDMHRVRFPSDHAAMLVKYTVAAEE